MEYGTTEDRVIETAAPEHAKRYMETFGAATNAWHNWRVRCLTRCRVTCSAFHITQ